MVTPSDELASPVLAPFWEQVRISLERNTSEWRGRMALPALDPKSRPALETLAGGPYNKTISLKKVEEKLQGLDFAADLPSALNILGYPISTAPQAKRDAREQAKHARQAAQEQAMQWPEHWASDWVISVRRAGLLANMNPEEAVGFVNSVRLVLDALGEEWEDRVSRVDLAARVLGSSHALDTGTRMERAVTRALRLEAEEEDPRSLWELAGAHFDLVSGPALTWNLQPLHGHPLQDLCAAATALETPFLLTQLALRKFPITVDPETVVLAVENPRVLEHATQRNSATSVVCTNGNPSGAVQLLLRQLLESGAEVRYHGDFDAAGLDICSRMFALGLTPWRMTSADYQHELAEAERHGVALPTDERAAGNTAWEPSLGEDFNATRLIVHEERLLDRIIEG